MSIAKANVYNRLNDISDDIQDEIEILEGIFKQIKLEKKQTINQRTGNHVYRRCSVIFCK